MTTRPVLLTLIVSALAFNIAQSATVTWTSLSAGDGSGSWNTAANPPWSTGAIPGATDTADFSTLDITNTPTSFVALDGNQSISALIFGDTVTSSGGVWQLIAGSVPGSTLTLTGAVPTITVNNMGGGRAALDVGLVGTNGFTKSGAGLLTLTNLNSGLSGNFIINGGTVGVQLGDAALGPVPGAVIPDNITLNGGALYNIRNGNQVSSTSLNAKRGITIGPNGGTFTVNNSPQVFSIYGPVTGSGMITKNGAGKVAFTNDISSITNKINVAAGTFGFSVGTSTLGGNPASFLADGVTLNGSALNNNAANNITSWTVTANRGVTLGSSGGIFNADSTSGNLGITVASVISGSGSLTKIGLGRLTLNAANTYTGGTIITNGSPISATTGAAIILGHPSALSSGNVVFSNAASLNGFRYTGVSGGIVPNNVALSTTEGLTNRWVVDSGTSVTFSGILSAGSATSLLQKDGMGTLIFSANNTCAGTNLVASGKLYGVTGGSCSNMPIVLFGATPTDVATLGVRITDNTRQWTCPGLECNFGTSGSALEFDFTTTPSTSLAPLKITGAANFVATPQVIVNAANLPVSTGDGYPLMTWGSTSGTAPSSAELTLLPSGKVSGTLSVVGNTLYLQITSTDEPLRWAAGNNNWNTYSVNWTNSALTPAPASFVDGDAVQFEDTQNTGGGIVTVEGNVTPASILVNSTNDYSLAGGVNGVIAGFGSITKSGSGTLTLSGQSGNTFLGGMTINNGTVIAAVADGTAFGSCGAGNVTVNSGGMLIADGTNSLVGLTTSSGKSITINSGAMLTNTGTSSSRLHRLVLNGGTLAASSANAATASWALDFGLATLGGGSSSLITGGNLALSQSGSTTFNVLSGDTLTVASVLDHTTQAADTGLTKNGAGILVLTATNTSTAPILINSGTVRLGNNLCLPKGLMSLATMTLASTDSTQRTITNSLNSGTASSVHTFGDGTGTGSFLFTGPLSIASGSTGRGFVTTTDVEFSGPFTGSNGTFTKTGARALTLSGNVTVNWTGGWKINAGSLLVNGALTSTSAVTVASSCRLGGTGTVNAPVTINSGGTIAPGTSIGTLTLTNTPALTGATLLMEINQTNSPNADKLVVTAGGLNFNGTTLTLTNTGPALTSGTFTLFSPGNTGTFAVTNLPAPASGYVWDLSTLASAGTAKIVATTASNPTNILWSVSGTQLTLNWPAGHTGWTLQSMTNPLANGLNGGTWVPVAGSTTTNQMTFTIDPAQPTVFYRLALP